MTTWRKRKPSEVAKVENKQGKRLEKNKPKIKTRKPNKEKSLDEVGGGGATERKARASCVENAMDVEGKNMRKEAQTLTGNRGAGKRDVKSDGYGKLVHS